MTQPSKQGHVAMPCNCLCGLVLAALIFLGAACNNSVKDIDGNVYRSVKIGNQVWMAQNLKTTRFRDGTPIPLTTDSSAWQSLSTPGYCWYDNFKKFKRDYGALYNWHAVNNGLLAPAGWHVPAEADWKTLITVLGGEKSAGGKLKEAGFIHWFEPNTGATNQARFSAFPSGMRQVVGGFIGSFTNGYWWSATQADNNTARFVALSDSSAGIGTFADNKRCGFSVRCVKD
jgi:uncharacterized protein (TIGR02145 family)